MYSELLKLKLV